MCPLEQEAGGDEAFPPTHWSLVQRVCAAEPQTKRQALAALVSRYQPALRSHLIRRQGMSHDQADDLLQSFLCEKVVAQNFIERAEKERGKFRTFLLTALQNFIKSENRKSSAHKRSPGVLSDINAHDSPRAGDLPADEAFDLEWARALLANVLAEMKEHCHRVGRADIWTVFETRLLGPILDDRPPPAYDELAGSHGFDSATQAANALVTAKRTFERLLRAAVGQYVKQPQAIDEEIGDLLRILSRGRGK